MKLLKFMKDGGPLSKVNGLFFIEIKSLFSIVLLHFFGGSREAYHNHAFHAVSWVLSGELREQDLEGESKTYTPSFKPVVTTRSKFHKVTGVRDSWVLTFRSPWSKTWKEWLPNENRYVDLTHGRKEI